MIELRYARDDDKELFLTMKKLVKSIEPEFKFIDPFVDRNGAIKQVAKVYG